MRITILPGFNLDSSILPLYFLPGRDFSSTHTQSPSCNLLGSIISSSPHTRHGTILNQAGSSPCRPSSTQGHADVLSFHSPHWLSKGDSKHMQDLVFIHLPLRYELPPVALGVEV